jgi:hypothetical protein
MAKNTAERRGNPRLDLACPASLYNRAGELIVRTKTVNVSDGGLLVAVPVQELGRLEEHANVAFSVPRSTATTYMLEDFACPARIVRHQPMVDDDFAAVALAFEKPQDLSLAV